MTTQTLAKKAFKFGLNGWTSLTHSDLYKLNLDGNGHKVRAEVSEKWAEVYHTNENVPKGNHRRVRVLLCNDEAEFVGFGPTQVCARESAMLSAKASGYKPSRPHR